MKKILFIVFLFALTNFLNAQDKWKIGASLGPTTSKVHGENITSTIGWGLNTGLNIYRFYNGHFFFKTGINYELKKYSGAGYNYNDNQFDTVTSKRNYLVLPLQFGYRFNFKKQSFFISTGSGVNFNFSSSVESSMNANYNTTAKNLDLDLSIGIGYMIKISPNLTLFANPEYSRLVFDLAEFEFYDTSYIDSWRFNLGLIYQL